MANVDIFIVSMGGSQDDNLQYVQTCLLLVWDIMMANDGNCKMVNGPAGTGHSQDGNLVYTVCQHVYSQYAR